MGFLIFVWPSVTLVILLYMAYTDQPVLVVGGAGFIGSFVVRELLQHGARVTVMVRPETGLWRLDDIRARVTILSCDLSDRAALTEAMISAHPAVVFNLAARVCATQSLELAEEMLRENVELLRNVLQAAAAVCVSRFVQIGTIEEYGLGQAPFREEQREMPISPYSMSKVAATHLALLFHRLGTMTVSVARLAATFGPMQGCGMLTPNFIRAGMERKDFTVNSSEYMRDFLFVEDAAVGICAVGASPHAAGEIINIGTTRHHRIRDVVNLINELMGAPIAIQFNAASYRKLDTPAFYMDVSKAERLIGFRAVTPFDEAMARTVAWYRDHWDVVEKELS